MPRKRADLLLVSRGLAPSRERAQAFIRLGRVSADGAPVTRAAASLHEDAALIVAPDRDFVSRGGAKLDGAIDALGVVLTDRVVADLGASTGGFTDCALRRGARRVYAVDVGHDQLAPELRSDARVVVRDGTNARYLERADFPEPLDVVLVDASFISLEKLTEALARILPPDGALVALVKPQFEVGKDEARKARGVVRDEAARLAAIADARAAVERAGFVVVAAVDSALAGPAGNVEHFLHARRLGAQSTITQTS